MKKILFILSTTVLLGSSLLAQTTTPTEVPKEEETPKQKDFDKKFRFGIRATPQLAWLSSKNDNAKGSGVVPAFGFGLVLDFRLSDIIHFSTGLGGDFDGGYVKYKYVNEPSNPAGDFSVNMVLDKENKLVESKDGATVDEYVFTNGNTQLTLNDRKYKSTYISIPLLLKMMTQEYSGLRHAFVFGGELGIRSGIKANDTYNEGYKSVVTGTSITTEKLTGDQLEVKGINVSKDGSALPMRFGMNLGYGIEYRIAGSTSFFTSINYFHSFTNLVRNDSKYLSKGVDNKINSDNTITFANLNQAHFAKAVRLSIGLLF